MRGRVGALETAVGMCQDAALYRFSQAPSRFRRAFVGDPPARVKPMAVRLQLGARVVREKPPPKRNRLP